MSLPLNITYRQATLDEIFRLRFAVLRPGLPAIKVYFPGDDAPPPAALHFGAFLQNSANIACLTYLASRHDNAPALQLRGMAVDEHYRSQGIGGQLLDVAQNSLPPSAPGILWCNARLLAVPFYERHGWHCISDTFLIEGVGPHRKMLKQR